MNDCLGVELCTVSIRRPEDDDDTVFSVLFSDFLDILLTIQVKGTCCGSDETLCLSHDRLCPRALDTRLNGGPLDPIPLSDDNDFLPFQLHIHPPS